IIESEREIDSETLKNYLPDYQGVKLPAVFRKQEEKAFSSEREILYKILFDMKTDMNDLKKLVLDIIQKGGRDLEFHENTTRVINNLFGDQKAEEQIANLTGNGVEDFSPRTARTDIQDTEEIVEESLSLSGNEMELIIKALEKHNHKRKIAAKELGISERTLYRKIKEYGIGV
ncbi:MAG: sigma-54-dependent Fis family transcriptional regulator, partial [Odoribacter sp.]|nr:sigma-54-dependent Fis family transcriptional regulator [Odoribacter sp.]